MLNNKSVLSLFSMIDPLLKTLDQIILLDMLVSSFVNLVLDIIYEINYRLNGLAVLKPWRKPLGGYIREEKQQ